MQREKSDGYQTFSLLLFTLPFSTQSLLTHKDEETNNWSPSLHAYSFLPQDKSSLTETPDKFVLLIKQSFLDPLY
jgi:hypothetical protein